MYACTMLLGRIYNVTNRFLINVTVWRKLFWERNCQLTLISRLPEPECRSTSIKCSRHTFAAIKSVCLRRRRLPAILTLINADYFLVMMIASLGTRYKPITQHAIIQQIIDSHVISSQLSSKRWLIGDKLLGFPITMFARKCTDFIILAYLCI